MKVVILQPSYLPWLGYFDQMRRADCFIFYDDVQFDKGGWRNRNRIKTPQGLQWLTVPVETRGKLGQSLLETNIDTRQHWWKKHLAAIRQNYQKAQYFQDYCAGITEVLSAGQSSLVALTLDSTLYLAQQLGIQTKTLRSSELGIVDADPTGRLVKICKHLGANAYLSGASGASYIQEEQFSQAGISVEYQEYRHPEYRQLHGEFVPYLSVIDLLFNEGPNSLEILSQKK